MVGEFSAAVPQPEIGWAEALCMILIYTDSIPLGVYVAKEKSRCILQRAFCSVYSGRSAFYRGTAAHNSVCISSQEH